MNLENLKNLERKELFDLALKMGLTPHHKCKNETVINMIKEKAFEKPKEAAKEAKEVKKAPEPIHNTPEMVEKEIASIKAKKPEFVSSYSVEDNTWTFDYKGARETGNLSIPLRVIVQKANNVARGKLQLMGMQGFDQIANNPKSIYTGTVLRV